MDTGIRYFLVEDWEPLENPTGRPDWPSAVPIYRTVQMTFEGSNSDVVVEGEDPREPIVSYFLGKDPSRWVAGLPTFGAVRYRDLYDGIDMRVVHDPRGVEYDLVLRPGAELSDAILRIDGAATSEVTDDGAIRMRTPGRAELIQHPPQSYELLADGTRRPLASRFIDLGNHRFRLAISDWQGLTPAVVDPIVAQPQGFTYLGGVGAEFGFDVVTFVGKPILTGCTSSPFSVDNNEEDFPSSPSAFQAEYDGELSGFVSGFSSDLWQLKWTTFFGIPQNQGGGVVVPHAVSVDGEGSVYIGGYTNSPNLPITVGSAQPSPLGLGDGFVAKLSSSGTSLIYSTYVTGSKFDTVEDIAVAPNGRAYLTGYTDATAATPPPTTGGVVEPVVGTVGGPYIGFVARLSASGNSYEYLTFVGSAAENTRPRAIALDFDDADPTRIGAVIAGDVRGNGLQTPGGFDTTIGGSQDAFVAVLNHDATAWLFGTYLGGSALTSDETSGEYAWGVSVNPSHLIAVSGQTNSSDFPITGNAFQGSMNGNNDAFVVRIDRGATNPLVYSSFYGGTTMECGLDVAIDSSGAIYATGWTTSSSGMPIVNPFMAQPNPTGGRDAFVLKIRNSALLLSSYLGGSGIDCANGIILEPGAFFVCGSTFSADFPANLGALIGFDQTLTGAGGTGTAPSMPAARDWNVDQSSLAAFPLLDAFLVRFEIQ